MSIEQGHGEMLSKRELVDRLPDLDRAQLSTLVADYRFNAGYTGFTLDKEYQAAHVEESEAAKAALKKFVVEKLGIMGMSDSELESFAEERTQYDETEEEETF